MAKKTNTTIGGHEYFRIKKKVGMRQNKNGEWRPEYKQFYGKSQKEALEKYEAYMNRCSLDATKCFGESVEWYISNIFIPDSSIKDSTKSLYVNAYLNTLTDSRLTGRRLEDITGADLQQVLNGSDSSPTTVRQAVKFIRKFYKYLESERIIFDVTKSLILPTVEHRTNSQDIVTYSDYEIDLFMSQTPAEHRLRLLIVLANNTGARIGELLALTYSDIKDDELYISKTLVEIDSFRNEDNVKRIRLEITPPKSKMSVRNLPLSPAVLDEIRHHREWHIKEMIKRGYKTDHIFTTNNGNLYYQSTLRKSFNRLCRSIGVESKNFHTFRRTFGTRLAARGVPIEVLSKLMGHSDISVTSKYYINISKEQKQAALAKLDY